MKLLYCHDNVYFTSEFGEIYSQGQFPYSYFEPFLDVFEDVNVIGRRAHIDKNIDIKKLNISSGPVIDFQLLPSINSPKDLIQNYKYVNAVIKKQVQHADAVVIRAVSDLGWLTYKHARAMNKPIAMEMAACAWDSTWNHGSPYGKIYAPIRHIRDKIITKNADHVIYVSQTFLQKRYKSNGYAAIASNVRINKPKKEILNNRLEKIENTEENNLYVIGIIGVLGHNLKGIHTALQALEQIESHVPGRFIFRILGPGNPHKYRKMAKSLGIEPYVFFDGVVQSGDAVLKWLQNIDIYIQPSYQEGVPRATIEAMSMGCPVIGSTAGGIPELLPPEWLHKPGDANQLGYLIETMLSSKEHQQTAAKRNFEHSKNYIAEHLMPIRQKFWNNFRNFVQEQKS